MNEVLFLVVGVLLGGAASFYGAYKVVVEQGKVIQGLKKQVEDLDQLLWGSRDAD